MLFGTVIIKNKNKKIINEDAVADHCTTSDSKVDMAAIIPKIKIEMYSFIFFFELKKGMKERNKQMINGISINLRAADVLFKLNNVKKHKIIVAKILRDILPTPLFFVLEEEAKWLSL